MGASGPAIISQGLDDLRKDSGLGGNTIAASDRFFNWANNNRSGAASLSNPITGAATLYKEGGAETMAPIEKQKADAKRMAATSAAANNALIDQAGAQRTNDEATAAGNLARDQALARRRSGYRQTALTAPLGGSGGTTAGRRTLLGA